jgi:hypothetical protein
MKRNFRSGIAALTLAVALSGCSSGDSFKKTFGLTANPPDAFAVGTQPPLSLPPELGQLPPPNPGEPRPQQEDAAQDGLDALSPASSITADTGTDSAGQQAFLSEAGPTPSPTIRADVNQTSLIAGCRRMRPLASRPPPATRRWIPIRARGCSNGF